MWKPTPASQASFVAPRRSFALVFLLVSCCGCLKADIYYFFSHDAAGDSITVTALYLNIAAENPADRDQLASLWKERGEIITNPFEINLFGGHRAILRIDPRHYQTIDMAGPSKEVPPVNESEIALDDIKVEPGKFFLNADNRLGYYHRFTLPGKTVDQMLAPASKAICKMLIEEIPLELKRRAAGGKTPTWDELRRELATTNDPKKPKPLPDSADGPAGPANGGNQSPEKKGLPIDEVSLNLIQKAAKSGELAVHRQGAEFSVAIPLSANDCREAKQSFDVALKAFAEQQKANAGPTADVPDLTAMIHAENDHEQWLVVKLDLSRPVRLAGGENATQEPKLAPHYRETIDFARTHDIPIDDTLSLKQVLDGLAGK